MNKVYPDRKGNLRNGNIEIFLEIVIDNYIQIKENKLKLSMSLESLRKGNIKKSGEYKKIQEEQFIKINASSTNLKLTIQSIILLNTFFESLINEIGLIELGQTYYTNNLDSLRTMAKWEIVLQLIFQNSLNRESQYYENFNRLVKSRNSLIHYKSAKIPDNTLNSIAKSFDKSLEQSKILESNINTLEDFFTDLKKILKGNALVDWQEIDKQLKRLKP